MIVARLLTLFCYTFILYQSNSVATEFVPDPAFRHHYLTVTKAYHAVHKREISSSKEAEEKLKHVDHLTVEIDLLGKHQLLDLQLNRDLIPNNYFEKHQKDGDYVVKRPQLEQEIELCHYNGNIRGIENSWVAVSTCRGLRGTLYDGNEVFYIERVSGNSSNSLADMHVIYRNADLQSNFTCGFKDAPAHLPNYLLDRQKNRRVRRNAEPIHGPYNSDRVSRYIELVLVVDNREYKHFNEDISRVNEHCKNIANIINSLYVPLNIFVALVGVVIWSNGDEIPLEENGDNTLTSFLTYRRERLAKEHPNDNAQLLTRITFKEGVVGKALKGPICTSAFSGGVTVDHSEIVGLVANTIAHEMGHNLGMEHDTENDCKCSGGKCIMAPSSGSYTPTEWSSCSRVALTMAFERGMDYCLRNKPTSLFESPVCGNGFVEPGEQCDCGLKEKCTNPCCDPSTCMLYANASCATGKCCDFQTCKPHPAGKICRDAEPECDLPEYCTGRSEYCPDDVFKIDGQVCDKGMAFCYQGNCRSHTDQCRILWGPSGLNSDPPCYNFNLKGDQHGNCGYNRLNKSFVKCEEADVLCGMLQCKHLNERLEFGIESAANLSHSFITGSDTNTIPCRTVMVDLGLNVVDPGLSPDGSKCAENHMCYNQKCLTIESLRKLTLPFKDVCPQNCNGNGICNSKGNCHCDKGYDPPYCDSSGYGGSSDSGPAENPYNRSTLRTVFYFMMLTCVPLVLILFLYSYYIRRSPSYFWKRDPRRTIQKSVQIHVNRGGDHHEGIVNSTAQSLLSNGKPTDASVKSSLRDSLIGNFKGFSITPISNTAKSSEPAKPVPLRSAPAPIMGLKKTETGATSTPTANSILTKNIHITPPLPPSNTVPTRPLISAPVLANTTSSTVKKLIDKNLPVRPAPPVPCVKPDRPNSTPCMLDEVNECSAGSQKAKEHSSTLNRLASFASKSLPQQTRNDNKKYTLPLKAAKIDKHTLKNLVISDPIPLNEPNIPVDPLPLSKDQHRSVVMRAQSLRHSANKPRLGAAMQPSFGSMRLSASQRPISIPACSRPTSPPPCPPPQPSVQSKAVGAVAYSNLSSDLGQSEDNIYAVIEEGPLEEPVKNTTSPTRRPVLGSGDGLLNEIVNEIQARNKNSIYSKDSEKGESTTTAASKGRSPAVQSRDDTLYENTSSYDNRQNAAPQSSPLSTTNSEYLKPIKYDELPTVEKVTKPNPLKVPEKSAPAYKPFNSSKKSLTPITSLHTKSKFASTSKVEKPKTSLASSENSSQESFKTTTTTTAKATGKSSVASAVSKFNAVDTSRKSSPPAAKSSSAKSSTVASMQKKFETQSKPS